MNHKKSTIFSKVIILVVGLIFFLIGFYAFLGTYQLIKEGVHTTGIVTDFNKSTNEDGSYYYPIIEFTTQEGKKIEFISSVGSGSPSHEVGDIVNILYNPNEANKAKINSFTYMYLFPVTFGGVGILLLFIFVLLVILKIRKNKLKTRLMQSGRVINASNARVELNSGYKVNGRSPYNITAQLEENGQVYIFKSENIWFDPTEYVDKDKLITVYVDGSNMKKYYMDISFLPKLAN